MAYNQARATGDAAVGLRLQIAGCPYEFVTDSDMAMATADGRRRVVGLLASSVGFSLKVDLPSGNLDAKVDALKVVEDEDLYATKAFGYLPDVTTYLTAELSSGASSMQVMSTAGIVAGDVVHVGTEAILVGDVPDDTTLASLTRGYWNTVPQKHYAPDGLDQPYVEVTNRPISLLGRRFRLYAYDDADVVTDAAANAGHQVFYGVVDAEPVLTEDDTTWEIAAAAITRILDGELGGDVREAVAPRGVYYPWSAPILFLVTEHTAAGIESSGSATLRKVFYYTGFTETNGDFLLALNTILDAQVNATCNTKLRAVARGDGSSWGLVATTDAATVRYLSVVIYSPVDGDATCHLLDQSTGVEIRTLVASTSYDLDYIGAPAPRAYFGNGPRHPRHQDSSARATAPATRLYLGGRIAVDAGVTAVQVEWPDLTKTYSVTDSDAALRWVELHPSSEDIAWSAGELPKVRVGRQYAVGGVADFIDALAVQGPELGNLGAVPDVSTDDVGDWHVELDADEGYVWANHRRYVTFGSAKLAEVLQHELRLRGAFLVVDATGHLNPKKLRLLAPTETSVKTIDAGSQLSSEGFPGWKRNPRGSINRVLFRLGWDPIAEEHRSSIDIPDLTAFARQKIWQRLEIAPRSYFAAGPVYTGESDYLPADDARRLAQVFLGVFGAPYAMIAVPVPLTHFDVGLGDSVLLTSDQIPDDVRGVRGIVAKLGLVVGKSFRPWHPAGELVVMIHGQNLAGYTPTARITSRALVSGTTYDLTINTGLYFGPDGVTTSPNYFVAGDSIRVLQKDSEAPGVRTGTVVSVTLPGTIRVTLSSAWSIGAHEIWDLMYGTGSTVNANQTAYCFIGDTGGHDGAIAGAPARTFGP